MFENLSTANVDRFSRMAAVGGAGGLRIGEETLEDHASISIVAWRNGWAPNLLCL